MKRAIAGLSLVLFFSGQGLAQEMIADSISMSKFTGLHQSGEIGQFLYIPYFSTNKSDKNNFIIRQINGQNFVEERVLRFELPTSYTLKASCYNGASYLLCFYDDAKKEDVFISVTGENVDKKKTSKATGNIYYLLNSESPEDFTVLSVNPKGGYSLEKFSTALESKWKKQFSVPAGVNREIVAVNTNMGKVQLLRKDTRPGNKYEFSLHYLEMNGGEDVTQVSLVAGDNKLYPTFFYEKEGVNYTGGYYFKDGVYEPAPAGVFLAGISPDGNLERTLKIPFSQVIESLKKTAGGKLSDDNTTIVFTGGFLSHESQNYLMIGQLMTRHNTETGATIDFGDFVTIKFSMEGEYRDAVTTPAGKSNIEVKGNLSKVNNLDLGIWLNNSSLLPFSHFVNAPGYPIVAYRSYESGGKVNICFRPVGIKDDTIHAECIGLFREMYKTTTPYDYTGNLATPPIHFRAIIPSKHDIMQVGTYELNDNLIRLTKIPVPRLDAMSRPIMPEDVAPPQAPEDAPNHDESGQPEENKAE